MNSEPYGSVLKPWDFSIRGFTTHPGLSLNHVLEMPHRSELLCLFYVPALVLLIESTFHMKRRSCQFNIDVRLIF